MRVWISGGEHSHGAAVAAARGPSCEVGEIDAVVVNMFADAGAAPFAELTDAAYTAACIDTPLALIAALQAGIARLARPGRIVIIAPAEHAGIWHGVHRSAAAAAMIGIARSLALEVGPAGIAVNTVAVGPRGSGEGVAGAVAYLLSPVAATVSGQILTVDGGDGLRMRMARRRD